MAELPEDMDMGWPGGEADGEEEPLFADDLMDDEDDPPPLPPPMPSLGEFSGGHSTTRVNGVMSGGSASGEGGGVFPDTQPGPSGAAAAGGDGAGANSQEPTQKKRKPILTLKTERVFSEKGLRYIEKEFPKLKFRGQGHEASDLKYLLQQYEHWANMLYPKLTFKDVTDRIETLASKKDFKSQLHQMRRRAARGGRDTPPLRSDDSDQEQEGSGPRTNDLTNGHPSPDNPEGGVPRDNDSDENDEEPSTSSGRTSASGGGVADRIHNADTVIMGGSNSSDVVTNGDADAVGGAGSSRYSSTCTALERLTMDAYGSSDDDD